MQYNIFRQREQRYIAISIQGLAAEFRIFVQLDGFDFKITQ